MYIVKVSTITCGNPGSIFVFNIVIRSMLLLFYIDQHSLFSVVYNRGRQSHRYSRFSDFPGSKSVAACNTDEQTFHLRLIQVITTLQCTYSKSDGSCICDVTAALFRPAPTQPDTQRSRTCRQLAIDTPSRHTTQTLFHYT